MSSLVYYIKYLQNKRTELLRAIGITNKVLFEYYPTFIVHDMDTNFIKYEILDEQLTVQIIVSELHRFSLTFCQNVADSESKMLCRAVVKVAYIYFNQIKFNPTQFNRRF
ncbi:hotdog family protein [Candidatus Enterovibrio altilux]|uniref:acyl-CoA thioesterase n=1 Tax=Candidatus Enterovibrio altilux TaxID=1927128 RepID=UPI001CC2210F|nr:acyl-CoA thioesterase [Candidatus Enterovibrio luxaltus]